MNETNKSVSFGKFASADELNKAYLALEKEFTKRCMRLKAAESEIARLNEALAKERTRSEAEYSDFAREIIEQYLLSVLENKSVPVLGERSGSTALTPVKKPRDLAEAGKLAKLFIENK